MYTTESGTIMNVSQRPKRRQYRGKITSRGVKSGSVVNIEAASKRVRVLSNCKTIAW